MRKWTVAIILAGLLLTSIRTSQASFDGILLRDFPSNSVLYQSVKNDNSINLLKLVIVLPQQSFNQNEAAAMISRIASLPSSLLEKVNKNGITIKLFIGKLTDNPTAKQLAGQVPRGYGDDMTWDDVPGIGGSKVILAKIGSSDKGKGHGSVNLELYELGHSIDRIVLGELSESQEFQRVWKKEHEKLFPGNRYFLYPEEYFAECFAMFYLNHETNEQLRLNAPETFNFIKNLH